MDPIYPKFATTHALFYDQPRHSVGDEAVTAFTPAVRDWSAWRNVVNGPWSYWGHCDDDLPEQGWKIHISAVPSTAAAVLADATALCHEQRLTFKHLKDAGNLLASVAKDADRGGAGKFITLYPRDEEALHRALTTLDAVIGGTAGPYILSDLRWASGPLFVRYGAFAPRHVVVDGVRLPAVRNTATGKLVPDVREAGFSVPSWVELPTFLKPHLDSLDMRPPEGFPRITAALHHSNAGGVYEAELNSESVILKEARPHAGWTPDGRDAVRRLQDEMETLRALPAAARAPRVLDSFDAHGHSFLVLEKLPGRSLNERVAATNPLTARGASSADYATYRAWALGVIAQARQAVDALHESGRTHGDLHPRNVLVDDDGGVRLLDFEMSVARGQTADQFMGAPGFTPPRQLDPFERDLYSLACLELHVFLPLTPLLQLGPTKAAELVAEATRAFDLRPTWGEGILSGLRATAATTPAIALPLVNATVEGLVHDAQQRRDDRLWPGDPRQFSEAPYSLAHGALGVAVALRGAGVGVPRAVRGWIQRQLGHDLRDLRDLRDHLGLLDGAAGAVWACRQLGWDDLADDALDDLSSRRLRGAGPDLYSGLPGVALVFAHERLRDPRLLDKAVDIADLLESHWSTRAAQPKVPTHGGGLLAGASGYALLSLRLFEATGEVRFLSAARYALRFDAASLVTTADGALHVNEGWRTVPYLANGSAGIGVVIAQYLRHAPADDELRHLLDGIVRAAMAPFAIQAGLFRGRAGLMTMLSVVQHEGQGSADTTSALALHAEKLRLHALPDGAILRFAGDGLMRASCDLATGSAGVIAALVHVDSHGDAPLCGAGIPYLASPRRHSVGLGPAVHVQGGETTGVHLVVADTRAR